MEEKPLKNFNVNDKFFTILLSLGYIFALSSVFFNFKIQASVIMFLLLSILVLFFNFGFRKTIILYLIFFVGLFRADNSIDKNNFFENVNAKNATISGQVVSSKDISTKNNKIKFFLKANDVRFYDYKYENINQKILVSIDYSKVLEDEILIGNYVEVKGKLTTPFVATNPYQFDYKKYLDYKDCKNIIYVKEDNLKTLKTIGFSRNLNDSWYYILQKFEVTRNKILKIHSKNIKSPKLEVLGGIVFGNETINPDENIKEQFKTSGLLHLLAASGLNVALIYGIWCWIANLVRFPYHLSILIGAFCVILYTFMTGFPPSILRAGIMLLFVLFGKLIDRNASSVALIFFVAFLILLFDPKMLFDIGFELSFVVTLGLIFCCPIVIEKFKENDKKYREKYKNSSTLEKHLRYLFSPINLVSIVLVPLVAQLWVIPLQVHYFNNLAPLSIFANICVVPFIGILSFIGFVSSIIALIPMLSSPLVFVFDVIANPLLALLIKISAIFSSFKYSLVSTIGFNLFQIFDFWFILTFLTFAIKYNFKNKKFNYLTLIALILFCLSFINFSSKTLKIEMFDVNNADCFLITTPNNKHIMIDTAKRSYKGTTDAQIIINPYLKNKKIQTIDYLIITHFDLDHCGGSLDILKNNKVKNVIIQKDEAKSEFSNLILEYLKENNLNYKIAKNNETIYSEDNLTLKTFKSDFKNDNESSIITLLEYKNKNVLFAADSGVIGLNEIIKYLPNKIDILKIGHHGAKNTVNSSVLERLKPSYALISVGVNKYNHPSDETINLLNSYKIPIIYTKNFGFVEIEFNKKKNDFIFKHFEIESKNLEEFSFSKENKFPFHRSEYFKKFILKNATYQQ